MKLISLCLISYSSEGEKRSLQGSSTSSQSSKSNLDLLISFCQNKLESESKSSIAEVDLISDGDTAFEGDFSSDDRLSNSTEESLALLSDDVRPYGETHSW